MTAEQVAARSPLTMRGAELVVAERLRQMTLEGYSPERDTRFTHGELSSAAWCYLTETMEHDHDDVCAVQPPPEWPWAAEEWKPCADPIRNLVRAAALIAAEVDRLLAARAVDVASPPTLISGGGATRAGEP